MHVEALTKALESMALGRLLRAKVGAIHQHLALIPEPVAQAGASSLQASALACAEILLLLLLLLDSLGQCRGICQIVTRFMAHGSYWVSPGSLQSSPESSSITCAPQLALSTTHAFQGHFQEGYVGSKAGWGPCMQMRQLGLCVEQSLMGSLCADAAAGAGKQRVVEEPLLMDMALQLLLGVLKKGVVHGPDTSAHSQALLGPLLPLLTAALQSRHAPCTSLALRCLAAVSAPPLPGQHPQHHRASLHSKPKPCMLPKFIVLHAERPGAHGDAEMKLVAKAHVADNQARILL